MTKTISISDELHKKLRREAAEKDKTIQELVEERLK